MINIDEDIEEADWPKRTNEQGWAQAGLRRTQLRSAIADHRRDGPDGPRAILDAADRHAPALEAAALLAFTRAKRKLPDVEAALEALSETLERLAEAPLRRALIDGGIAAARNLSMQGLSDQVDTQVRAAKRIEPPEWGLTEFFAFGVDDPEIAKWAKKRAAELVTEVTTATRRAIRAVMTKLLGLPAGQLTQKEAHAQIAAIVGDAKRAQVIARTETMIASNEGQKQAWQQAVDLGLLPPEPLRRWIVTDDDHLCPQCEPMGDTVAPLHGQYPGGHNGPPLHPNCRCTEGLTF